MSRSKRERVLVHIGTSRNMLTGIVTLTLFDGSEPDRPNTLHLTTEDVEELARWVAKVKDEK